MFDNLKIKRVLISVSDKNGLKEFCQFLNDNKVEIFSTGGTLEFLSNNGIIAHSVSQLTDLPSILDGRVKTLHPYIHSALLADKNKIEHINSLNERNIVPFDMLVVNFYPFEKVIANKFSDDTEIIENIDIGGPAMVRSASKNFSSVAVLTSDKQYDSIINELKDSNLEISLKTRKKLAAAAFQRVAEYDIAISNYFNNEKSFNISLLKEYDLRYGENPHQSAGLYGHFFDYFDFIHGKALSYNNILDISSAVELVEELPLNSCVIVKHNNPCGVAIGSSIEEAYKKALSSDPKSAFGGVVALNNSIDINLAKLINELFLEVLILPSCSNEVLDILKLKKDRRIIVQKSNLNRNEKMIRNIPGGFLIQDKDSLVLNEDKVEVVTEHSPNSREMEDLKFAWIVAKHVKSNAIILAKDLKTIGIGAGQMSRVDSSKIASIKAEEFEHETKDCVVASDAFFPFADGLEVAVKIGATAIIQPGGSIRDNEVIEYANKNDLAMVFTKIRHFKH